MFAGRVSVQPRGLGHSHRNKAILWDVPFDENGSLLGRSMTGAGGDQFHQLHCRGSLEEV